MYNKRSIDSIKMNYWYMYLERKGEKTRIYITSDVDTDVIKHFSTFKVANAVKSFRSSAEIDLSTLDMLFSSRCIYAETRSYDTY